ncbi:SUMF1/EgtB/PvdO family nonheme iron enzyme [Leptospira harrisiae]|uniref:Cysteine-type sulfatase aerobic maturase n=1 Tax=Leptospira harrisiae TaxID=2023189 RepID=A0A2N0AID6_9LEPT|nr:SUMF1/EgtB/PvdO family nonheme iron enzyme [Leptospira harrisiae]PJZ84049.1 cysteine-type sulfatase aerobic maturase [Leptospira harrisiae]PKA08035.1 cysteine-type sulfatase aerobic maturase [Leptospira harrisiae]
MVWVPSGQFEKGSNVYPEESPMYQTSVSGFWMDETEVTNDEFAKFVWETGYQTEAEAKFIPNLHPNDLILNEPGAVVFQKPKVDLKASAIDWWSYVPGTSWRHPDGPDSSIEGKGSFPVVAVSYIDAFNFAKWKGHTLPTEVEWEWAAANGSQEEANTWQGEFPYLDEGKDGFIGISPVGCFAKNKFGLYDMIGNVWEFTADPWLVDKNLDKSKYHTIKGGSFLCSPNYCKRYRAQAKQPQEDHLATNHIGFRTILHIRINTIHQNKEN